MNLFCFDLSFSMAEGLLFSLEIMPCSFRMQIKSACQMLVALGVDSRRVYEEEFELHFLNQSAEFFKANKFIAV